MKGGEGETKVKRERKDKKEGKSRKKRGEERMGGKNEGTCGWKGK